MTEEEARMTEIDALLPVTAVCCAARFDPAARPIYNTHMCNARLIKLYLCALTLISMLSITPSFATTYATWIMIWYGHDQAWWSAGNSDASLDLVNGEWKTLDWADESQFSAHLDGIRKAGVSVVIADLTNGWNWLDGRCRRIMELCAKKGMKFCVAENSGGNTQAFESHARDIWNNFAGPDAPNHEAYFRYRGKPLIVCYSVRDWYTSYLKMSTPFRSRFSLVWASGEDSCANKWGWQLEPWVASVPSKDSMYVTSAVRWNPADGAMWRKSIAYLDYNFALAKKSDPEYVVIGCYDDPTERNTWAVCNTTKCELGRQIRDKTGALNPSALYDRVKQWIAGRPPVEPGGLLRDGAYRIINPADGKRLGIRNTEKLSQGAPGAALIETNPTKAPLGLFWLYHLGKNHYRIIAVHSGLALETSDSPDAGELGVIQNWDSTEARQRWTLARGTDGCLKITNDATGEALGSGEWRFRPVITL